MIFARNTKTHVEVKTGVSTAREDRLVAMDGYVKGQPLIRSTNDGAYSGKVYRFPITKQITEREAYAYYRSLQVAHDFHVKRAKEQQRIAQLTQSSMTQSSTPSPSGLIPNINPSVILGQMLQSQPQSTYYTPPRDSMDRTDIYIIPKLYQYFPFLDCDNEDMYTEAVCLLDMDKVSWVSYKSTPSKNSFWIFCDKPGDFNATLDFIKQYPADSRYSWVAEHKGEFCIRGIPRKGETPEKYQSNGTLSKPFQFWISEFDEYWENGDLISYIRMNSVGDNI